MTAHSLVIFTYFYNVTLGIKHEQVFSVPDSCSEPDQDEIDFVHKINEHLEMRVSINNLSYFLGQYIVYLFNLEIAADSYQSIHKSFANQIFVTDCHFTWKKSNNY